jgi:hypothetical protein
VRQTLCWSGMPTGIGPHSPILVGRLQATQAPVQDRLQQTPSAQKPDSQSAAAAQVDPSGRLLQLAPLQHMPRMQALLRHSLPQTHAVPAAFLTAGPSPRHVEASSADGRSPPPPIGASLAGVPASPPPVAASVSSKSVTDSIVHPPTTSARKAQSPTRGPRASFVWVIRKPSSKPT